MIPFLGKENELRLEVSVSSRAYISPKFSLSRKTDSGKHLSRLSLASLPDLHADDKYVGED